MTSINSEFGNCASKLDEICTAFRDSPQLSEESLRPVATILLRCSQVLTSWGQDTGASSSVLDHSLRRASKLRTSTVILLQELNELIKHTAVHLLDAKQKPIVWPGQNPALGCLTEAQEIIDGLLELRAALLNPYDDFDPEPVPDAEEWSVLDQEYATRAFAAAPGFLIDRLICANQRRREYMPPKLRRGITHKNSGIGRLVALSRSSNSSTLGSDAGVSTGTAPSTRRGADSIFSYNTFSDQGSVATSYAFSAATSRMVNDRNPPEPPVDIHVGHNLPFKCQYCSFDVPLEFKGQSMTLEDWHAHLYLDLQAYSCTFEDCNRPHELFSKKEDWFQHELHAHRIQWRKVWRCADPGCNTEFQDPALFKQHLTSNHSDTVSKLSPSSLDVVLETCQSREHEICLQTCCPLCGVSYKKSSRTEWKEHIAHHLEQFALLALPMKGQEGMHHIGTVPEEE
ncbi:hypothetical protein QBC43DRAFT_125765 [Cladorrhinum sp. PSN259]|nr:hypothetical protein QBC43DRAFT_125765 [Cladorrhinum sp. PSN259]